MIVRISPWVLILAFFSNSLLAETYTREFTYKALQEDNKLTSSIIALDQVRILLLQKIGSHIQQTIKITEDGSVNSYARKDVEAVTANLTKVNILEEKWDESSYYIKAEIDANTQRVLDALEEYKNDHSEKSRQLLKALTLNERALQKSREKITRLKRELEFSKTGSQNTKALTQYQAETNKLSTEGIFAEGFEYQQQGKYAEAIKKYLKIAKQGNAVAQQLLGSLYMKGQGVEQDFTKAIHWFQKAADQGESIAQYYLGISYLKGEGVEQDTSKAAQLLHESAEQGDALAQYQLGNLYLTGKGVEKKYFMAAHWLHKAAEQREAIAQYTLGMMYAQGKGVTQNDDEAIYWYRKAAEQDFNEAKKMINDFDKDD